jgi:hypothetical protein
MYEIEGIGGPKLTLLSALSWGTFPTSGSNESQIIELQLVDDVADTKHRIYFRFDAESWFQNGTISPGIVRLTLPSSTFGGYRLTGGKHCFFLYVTNVVGRSSNSINVSYAVVGTNIPPSLTLLSQDIWEKFSPTEGVIDRFVDVLVFDPDIGKTWILYRRVDWESWEQVASVQPGEWRISFNRAYFMKRTLSGGIHQVSVMVKDNIGSPSNAISMTLTVAQAGRMNLVSLSSSSLGDFPENEPIKDQMIQFQCNDSAIDKTWTMYRRFDSELWDSIGSVNPGIHVLTFSSKCFTGNHSTLGTHRISVLMKDSDGATSNAISFTYKVFHPHQMVLTLLSSQSLGVFPENGPTEDQYIRFSFLDSEGGRLWLLYFQFDSESWELFNTITPGLWKLHIRSSDFYGSRISIGRHFYSIQVADANDVTSNTITVTYFVGTPPTESYPSPTNESDSNSGSDSTGEIVGISVGVGVGAIIAAIAIGICCWRKRRNRDGLGSVSPSREPMTDSRWNEPPSYPSLRQGAHPSYLRPTYA